LITVRQAAWQSSGAKRTGEAYLKRNRVPPSPGAQAVSSGTEIDASLLHLPQPDINGYAMAAAETWLGQGCGNEIRFLYLVAMLAVSQVYLANLAADKDADAGWLGREPDQI